MHNDTIYIPDDVSEILNEFRRYGYEAYVVGGCVRDSLMCRKPHDWDICTNATPEQVHSVFDDSGLQIYDTGIQHGTVTIMKSYIGYEVTTYRAETEYSDHRHPDSVQFAKTLEEDLLRRDFTINAIAYDPKSGLKDPYHGQEDLRFKILRCVGEPDERFQEDALRVLRALRFAAVYGFAIEEKTSEAIFAHAKDLQYVSKERIRDELCKMIIGKNLKFIMEKYAPVFAEIIPELEPMFGFQQNNHFHIYDVWEHTVVAVNAAPTDMIVRMALLLHDIGKPFSYTTDASGCGHFYGHADISADFAEDILKELRFDNETSKDIIALIRNHSQTFDVTPTFARKMLNKLGEEQFSKLIDVREADVTAQLPSVLEGRLSKVAKIRVITAEIIANQNCFSMKDLAVNGHDLIRMGYQPGPKLGQKLQELFAQVLEHPEINEKETLLSMATIR